jgi:hypothetical protein
MNRQDVIAKCLAAGVPILHGRIDRTLFESALRESHSLVSQPLVGGVNEAVTNPERAPARQGDRPLPR